MNSTHALARAAGILALIGIGSGVPRTPPALAAGGPRPTVGAPSSIAAGPGGDAWFTGLGSEVIGRMGPDGRLTIFPSQPLAGTAEPPTAATPQAGASTPTVVDPRTAWLQAQSAFLAALIATPLVGAERSGEGPLWDTLLRALSSYMVTSAAWATAPVPMQTALTGRAVGSQQMGYLVQDWRTPVGRMRLVTVADLGPAPLYAASGSADPTDYAFRMLCFGPARAPLYAAQLLIWQGDHGIHSQVLWAHKDWRNVLRSPAIRGGMVVDDVRGWRDTRDAWQIALIESDICLADETGVAAEGVALVPGAATWAAASAMFPRDLYDQLPVYQPTLQFTDATGSALRLTGALFARTILPDESASSEHPYVTRLFLRISDAYAGQPWQVVPSPYATLMQVIVAGRKAGRDCNEYTFSGLVTRPSLWSQLCAVRWGDLRSVQNQVNPGPPYRPVPTTYTAATSAGTLSITIVPLHGEWLVDQVQLR
jgi:hypothetical protein